MKVTELNKKSRTAQEIFEEIADISKNNNHHFKYFIPHFIYISNDFDIVPRLQDYNIYRL